MHFCRQIGIEPGLEGAVVINQIWDSINSNFRYPQYIPFVKEEKRATAIYESGGEEKSVEIPVLAYTQTGPVLREEYADYALVHVVPLSLWKDALQRTGEAEKDCHIRILSGEGGAPADLDSLEEEAVRLVSGQYETESENRVRERLSNDRLIYGMKVILGGFCALFALIGIANVFSNTLGFLRQRKREFAGYMSIGLTPWEMREVFCIEAFVIAGKPLFITLPLTALFAQYAITASYLDPMVFWAQAPVIPILIFAAAIVFFVALAYYIGGKRLLRCDLSETLRNDL